MKIELTNLGLIIKKLPDDIFSYILEDVKDIHHHEQMISGMSSIGVPKHYYMRDSSRLKQYVLNVSQEYFQSFNSAIDYKLRSDGVEPSSRLVALEPWINIQKKNEWIPAHDHSGVMAYSIWVSVPEQNTFEIMYSTITGETMKHAISVGKEQQGTIILFPSKLIHTVHPFYNSDQTRISISGNLILK